MKNTKSSIWLSALVTGGICLLVYVRALSCKFVNLDDLNYVVNNVNIRHLDMHLIVWAFTKPLDLWIPLTWLSFALDYSIWGLDAYGYHLTNILLHSINAGLVVLIADQLCRKLFAEGEYSPETSRLYPVVLVVAGLAFGIHPLRVESVAWVAERKDVLSGVFSLGTLYFYINAVQHGEPARKRMNLIVSLALFTFSLMAKPVSVVLPAIMLVVDWYPLKRFVKGNMHLLLVEKLPFMLLSFGTAVITMSVAVHKNMLVPIDLLPVSERLFISGRAIFEYMYLLLFPVGIIPYYVIPDPVPLSYAIKTMAVVVVAGYCAYSARKRPWVLATFLGFIIPILPVLSVTQNGAQSLAARYTYLPSVAASIALGAALFPLLRRIRLSWHRSGMVAVGGCVVVLLLSYAWMTQRLIGVWNDSVTFWSRVIELQPTYRAYKERGVNNSTSGRYPEAIRDLTVAIGLARESGIPDLYNLYAWRGEMNRVTGHPAEAVADLTAAIDIQPRPVYYYIRGVALQSLGRTAESKADLTRAGNNHGPIDWYEE